jgi:hypothetical protein
MRYIALIYTNEATDPALDSPERVVMRTEFGALTQQMAGAEVLRAGAGLQPTTTATTVRVREGKTLTTDGPFAETREQLGGYYILDCKDLDEAIQWASKIPSARWGSIEVRPELSM